MIDRDWSHLYLPFAKALRNVLDLANKETNGKFDGFTKWALFEGYRSKARQAELYKAGKTPMRSPIWHGKGLAADIVWWDADGDPHWDGPPDLWARLGHAARANGLVWGGDWHSRDCVHVEASLSLKRQWLKERGK